MKPLLASFLTISLVTLSCHVLTPAATPPPANMPNILETAWDDLSIFIDGLVPAAQPALDQLGGASVYHIEMTIDDDFFNVTGTQDVRYTNTEEVPLGEIHFRLFPNILGGKMQISNLRVGELATWPRYELGNSLMIVPLTQLLEPGENVIIHMDFAITVPRSIDLNYGVLAYADDVLALAHAYPMIAVYNDEGWNAEIPPQSGDVAFADASFYLVRVTAPKGVTVVTSGRTISSEAAGQVQILNVASGPARDFYLAASSKYEAATLTIGEVTIRSFAQKGLKDGSQAALEIASRALEVFSARYAPYPYSELDIVATPTLLLGIEYPGIIAITSRIYEGGRANPYFESTLVHEVGHQWFYNLVGGDQLDEPWLDESLTQFVTLQYFTDEYGGQYADDFRASLEDRWTSIGNSDIPIGLPVADYTGVEYSAIVYGRGPLFFIELKDRMGAEAFDAFMKEYTDSLSWSITTTETLHSLAEIKCTCELDDLFDKWVYP